MWRTDRDRKIGYGLGKEMPGLGWCIHNLFQASKK